MSARNQDQGSGLAENLADILRRIALDGLRDGLPLATNFLFYGGLRFMPLAELSAIPCVGPLMVTALAVPFLGSAWAASRKLRNLLEHHLVVCLGGYRCRFYVPWRSGGGGTSVGGPSPSTR